MVRANPLQILAVLRQRFRSGLRALSGSAVRLDSAEGRQRSDARGLSR